MSITLLDGGMGQELLKRSQREPTPMWSADVMLNEPELVSQLHYDFIQAGSQVITLNNYTATPARLRREGQYEQITNLHESAKQAAKEAVSKAADTGQNTDVKIAGCLPPLVASYRPDAALSYEDSLAQYRQLVELQADGCDQFICETMSSISEAVAACTAGSESGKKVWVALSVEDTMSQKLRSGEALSEAITEISRLQPDAILLNCSKPEAISHAWPLMTTCELKLGAYANGFTSVDSLYPGATVQVLSARKDLTPQLYAQYALQWVEQGASIIGGCCEIGPLHIAKLNQLLNSTESAS